MSIWKLDGREGKVRLRWIHFNRTKYSAPATNGQRTERPKSPRALRMTSVWTPATGARMEPFAKRCIVILILESGLQDQWKNKDKSTLIRQETYRKVTARAGYGLGNGLSVTLQKATCLIT